MAAKDHKSALLTTPIKTFNGDRGRVAEYEAVTDAEMHIQDAAIAYAKANRKEIVARLTDTARFPGEDLPVSVFMAGSPGAGKTEASIELLASLDGGPEVLRIDPDELRSEFPGYTGGNAWLFQRAVTVIVERIHDTALKQCQSFLLDGTLSNYNVAESNITRSLNKSRPVQILYVYQEPLSAWRFVQARELRDGRGILPSTFVDQYFAARKVVDELKVKFSQAIKIDLLLKNIDGSRRQYCANVDRIENYVPEKYTRGDVEKLVL